MITFSGHFLCGNDRMMRHLQRVLNVSLNPHPIIISVPVKIMSLKYPALPYLTFSEPHLMSENTGPEDHASGNKMSKLSFLKVPVERFIFKLSQKAVKPCRTMSLYSMNSPEKRLMIQSNSAQNFQINSTAVLQLLHGKRIITTTKTNNLKKHHQGPPGLLGKGIA